MLQFEDRDEGKIDMSREFGTKASVELFDPDHDTEASVGVQGRNLEVPRNQVRLGTTNDPGRVLALEAQARSVYESWIELLTKGSTLRMAQTRSFNGQEIRRNLRAGQHDTYLTSVIGHLLSLKRSCVSWS